MKKNILSSAILLATSGTVNAAAITSITISDVWDSQTGINDKFNTIGGISGSDGSAGRFGFNLGTTSHWTGDTGTDMLWGGVNQEGGVFTTGFLFGGETFEPNTSTIFTDSSSNGGAVGDITDSVLTVTNLDIGGLFAGATNLPMRPEAGTLKTNFINDIGGGDFELAFSWSHLLTFEETGDPSYAYFFGYWIIEGIAHTETSSVPVPATAWLMGSGLVGLAGVARRRKSKTA